MVYVSHYNQNYVNHCCSCLAVCWMRRFISALIQLFAHSDFTQFHIVLDCMHKVHTHTLTTCRPCTIHDGCHRCQCIHKYNLLHTYIHIYICPRSQVEWPPPGHVVSQSSWGPGPGISYGMAATGLLLLVALLLTCCWPGSCQPAASSKEPAAVSSSSQPAGQQASCTQPASQPASHPKPPPHRGGWGKIHGQQTPSPNPQGGWG